MSSKERMQRYKDKIYNGILDAAMEILKTEGCESLSVRKIADKIEYSVPVIYSYFLNKEAVLIELSRKGFTKLITCIEKSLKGLISPEERMEAMLSTLIEFAHKEKELNQLMYSVGVHVIDVEETFPVLKVISDLFRKELNDLKAGEIISEDSFRSTYLTFLSIAHRLVAVNHYYKNIDPAINSIVLKKTVHAILQPIDA
ncbi:TetR/AcrR family transcriptional regulator [Mucilaginibacter endophyticus]|uniref:TetR/AcrR family transcriptional regulator n=1 Tax=Mucilaginibacter endophyticus TaxID=2675003 RepID=UPI000E0CF26F|nr:TetR/AcrR family transcriptional regulator [Mucilaginibacter endophyticus]